jgi:hypothetical protein
LRVASCFAARLLLTARAKVWDVANGSIRPLTKLICDKSLVHVAVPSQWSVGGGARSALAIADDDGDIHFFTC